MHPPQSSTWLDRHDPVAAVSARTWEAIREALAEALGEVVDDDYLVEDELIGSSLSRVSP